MAPAAAVTGADRIAAGFVATLRTLGLDVPVGAAVAFYEALGAVGLDARDDVYWAGRSTLLHDPEDVGTYNSAFGAYWEQAGLLMSVSPSPAETMILAVDDPDQLPDGDETEADGPVVSVRYSSQEILKHKDFSEYTTIELAESQRLMTQIVSVGGRRSSRRRVATSKNSGRPDLRRTVRRAMRSSGEPIERRFTTTGERQRRVVFLLDISGSMETYARALIRFVQAAVVGRRRVEVFTLGTRLTRVTRELSSRDPDRAVAMASDAAVDWSGGTRLGDSLRAFNNEWGQRGMARGATVVILSDGWDRGDPETMTEQMSRLQRVTHQVVWVNPLKASAGYQPLAQGMAAAMPFVDQFIEGHCLDSLEYLATLLSEEKR